MSKIRKTYFRLIVLFCLFLPIGFLKAQSVFIDLKIDVHPDLAISFKTKYYKEDRLKTYLFQRIEKLFQDHNIMVEPDKTACDFYLEGTVYVKHFDETTASFSIRVNTEDMQIVPKDQLLPKMIFNPFDTGGCEFSDELFQAVNFAIDDFVLLMKENEVFNFLVHPVYKKAPSIKPDDLSGKNLNELKDYIRIMIDEIKVAINISNKTELTQIVQLPPKGYIDELKVIQEQLKQLQQQEKSTKNMMAEILKYQRRINYRDYASIVIKVNKITAVVSDGRFSALIRPDAICKECRDVIIDATNLAKIKKIEDLRNFAQYEQYFNYFSIHGKCSGDGKSIIISVQDYENIFIINENSAVQPKGEILRSAKTKDHPNPRILVLEESK